MNLKQFNFYSTRQVNCLLVEKRQPGLGHKHLQKRREKERKREERGGYFVTQVHNKNVPSTNRRPRRSETKFSQREKTLFFYAEKGKRKTKERARVRFLFVLEREREERDSFVVVVSLTSFTSSSPGHHPWRRRREKCSLGCDWLSCHGGGFFHHQHHQQQHKRV